MQPVLGVTPKSRTTLFTMYVACTDRVGKNAHKTLIFSETCIHFRVGQNSSMYNKIKYKKIICIPKDIFA